MAKPSGKVNAALEKALNDELKEITKRGEDGKFIASATERMKILDRCLKWQSIKLHTVDEDWGKNFEDKSEK